jgi:Putative beta-barrel porin-2, OmpL-like. bbp2
VKKENVITRNVKIMTTLLRKAVTVAATPALLFVSFALAQAPLGSAQTQTESGTQTAKLGDAAQPASDKGGSDVSAASSKPAEPAVKIVDPAEVTKELELLKSRIEQLETELKAHGTPEQPSSVASGSPAKATDAAPDAAPAAAPAGPLQSQSETVSTPPATAPPTVDTVTPFAFADWTWLNGNPRTKDAVWDSKFFTPEIRFDTNFVSSFNHPKDDTLGGSTEIFRSNEIQIEQISFGGDFHWQNVRGRVLTLGGMFGVTTPRNDASAGRGQWDLRGAYKYFAEAYGGYHFNVNHGLNVDAGIFVSYIGLFSYYNFDNWAYQPSYVSSNTPWFFNGLRVQWFPTNKLKIEPWVINGWQSYGRMGGRPGLGGQILYRPTGWMSLVFNNYGMGEDTLGNGDGQFGRSRIHTDDSVEIKYYDHPEKTLDKMAFTLTGDLGCEYGGHGNFVSAQGRTINNNVNCHHNTATSSKQTFAGWMLYNRMWFKKDVYAITVGGGAIDNPGRYLALLPPINGADAISGSPYFTQNPGDPYKAWDGSVTFDWMPKQYITFLWEYGYRHANVPYFTGRGGITPGDNINTSTVPNPAAGSVVPGTTFVPGPNLSATPGFTCIAGSGFCPDLRRDEGSIRMAIMVKF